MMNNEIIKFLVPAFDPIQIVFFILIFGSGLVTMFWVWKRATPDSWEHIWNGGTLNDKSDDLDAEHGSVNDLSHAVATTPEKLAEIMPGILLIFGLLGTFLGLGLALDHASNILGDANGAADGMDKAMNNMMGMMQGLGTKFKTSTWGIIGFLVLKAWSSAYGIEEKRLRWCVKKVKVQLDQSRHEHEQRAHSESNQLIAAIEKIGVGLSKTFQQEASETRVVLSKNQEQSEHANIALKSLKVLLEMLLHKTGELVVSSTSTSSELASFVQANNANMSAMADSSSIMADAAGRVGESANDLKTAIGGFKDGVAEVLDTLKKDLGGTISTMSDSFGQNMTTMSTDLKEATTGIALAVNTLSSSVEATMSSVERTIDESLKIQAKAQGESSQMQKKAQIEFMSTSATLNEKVIAMTGLVEMLKDNITSGLRAVSDSNLKVASLTKRYEAITENASKTTEVISEFAKNSKDSNEGLLSSIASLREQHSESIKNASETSRSLNAFTTQKKAFDDLQLKTTHQSFSDVLDTLKVISKHLEPHQSEMIK